MKRQCVMVLRGLVLVSGVLLALVTSSVSADPALPLPRIPICGDQDGSELPFSFNCPDFVPVPDVQTFRVPGSGVVELRFDFVFREAALNNELGFFLVDDASGSIAGLRPGDAGYLAAAFARATIVFPSGSSASTADVTLTLNGGDILLFFIVQGSTLANVLVNNPDNELGKSPLAFFSFDALNPDGVDHFVGFENTVNQYTQFGFEDLTGGGDRDYDDVVYNVYPPLQPLTACLPLSPIAEAVQAVVNEPFYCQNSFDELIILPDPPASGRPAFEKFAALARGARLEVDFVNMIWQDEKFPSDDMGPGDNGPMVIFLQGIRDLYEGVKANPASYPQGVRVRILTGLQYSFISDPLKDQRVSILRALERLGVPGADVGWQLEIGAYRKSSTTDIIPQRGTHSHVKMLIVDGKSAIVAGYNMEYEYLSRGDSPSGGTLTPKHDFGVAVSGPIVQSSLGVYRELWRDARICRASIGIFCILEDTASAIGLLPPPLPQGGIPASVFSLFRNDEPGQKQSDRAIVAAIEAAQNNINIIQARYFENVPIGLPFSPSCIFQRNPTLCDDWGPMPYTRAVVAALEKGVRVRLLLPLAKLEDRSYNLAGALNLILQARRRSLNLEVGFFGSRQNRPPIHGKALSIDGQFLIVGSQNWDHSAFGNLQDIWRGSFDLAEYNLGVDSTLAATQFNDHFERMWTNKTAFWPPPFGPGD